MSDENNADTSQTNNQSNANQPETVSVSKSDWETAQQALKVSQELRERAESVGVSDPLLYVDSLEASAYEKYSDGQKANPAPATPAPAPGNTGQPAAASPAQPQAKAQPDNSLVIQSLITGQFVEYGQNYYADGKKPPYDKAALLKVIEKEYPLVERMAMKSHGGNLFQAAERLLRLDDTEATQRKAASDSNVAIDNARQTAQVTDGGRRAEPGKPLSPEEKRAAYNKQAADEIAPDTIKIKK